MHFWDDLLASERGFAFARDPMILCDLAGMIRGANLAFAALFGEIVGSYTGKRIDDLEELFSSRLSNSLCPRNGVVARRAHSTDDGPFACQTSDLCVSHCTTRFVDERGTSHQLFASETPLIQPDTGLCFGSTISFSRLENREENKTSLNEAISHHLMWTVYAASYDEIIPRLFFYREALERHLKALNHEDLKSIIDVGAGTGIQSVALLERGKSVTAVDPNTAMIRRLRTKISSKHAESCRVLEQSAHSLPEIAPSHFDAATILLAFFDMNQPWLALREIERVLTPGGLVVLTEPKECFDVKHLMAAGKDYLIQSGKFAELAEHWQRIESIAPLIARRIADVHEGRGQVQHSSVWNAENVFRDLTNRGYSELQCVESHLGNCATISGRKPIGNANAMIG